MRTCELDIPSSFIIIKNKRHAGIYLGAELVMRGFVFAMPFEKILEESTNNRQLHTIQQAKMLDMQSMLINIHVIVMVVVVIFQYTQTQTIIL